MICKKIKFVDYNGVDREEAHYFNLTKSELVKMDLSTAGGYEAMLTRLVETRDIPEITKIFDNIIKLSYGRKSPDGGYFEKSDELTTKFLQSPAYDVLFMDFIENPEHFAEFLNGVIPADVRAKVEAENANNNNA